MNDPHTIPERLPIGTLDGVDFDVAAWGPAQADVDFSVACMFEHEQDGAPVAGGLLGLDTALGSQLTALRASGDFRAQEMETILISLPPGTIPARAVLVIGLGNPETLDGDRLRRATRVAMREAIRQGARSLAFAPSVLDGGHTDNAGLDMPRMMMDGMLGALRAEHALATAGLAPPPSVQRCTFDVGAPRLHSSGEAFIAAFNEFAQARGG
ncbi:UNVERIFIED_ORG: cytosol aminopeptidase family protein [Zoogloea ramigera]|uniref:M17 family peptidase N-terminal domain-containing protein n=1 Tax=Duganella zoogloeoides TaxID=75659 RepID=A0ABZ0XZY8_9BURK|nr:M17 family peptidase N-terminal domain-containing protein [Duganella zoogloeoides]WQH05340.1 M17 family peptidase N-terminal domain-containing protein [Duganella zoogloeoides]